MESIATGRESEARRLPVETVDAATRAARQYLTFMLGETTFATSIRTIKEIIEYRQLTEVPRMHAFILGVINLRGTVVPVIDVGVRFGKPPTDVTKRTRIVIFEVTGENALQALGIRVDAVNAVLEIPAADIRPAPAFGADIRTDFISGMGKIDERFITILNIERVLSLDEMTALVDNDGALQSRQWD